MSKVPDMHDIQLWSGRKFHFVWSKVSRFWVTCHFETSAPNDPKMILNTKRSNVPHIHTTAAKFQSVLRYGELFSSYRTFLRQVHRKTTQRPRTLKGQRYPIYMLQLPRVPDFTPFCSTASRVWVTGHFETSAPKDPKMILNTKTSKVPHMPIYIGELPNFNPFCSMASRFRVTDSFETSAQKAYKMTLNTKGQRYPVHVTTAPRVPNFTLFRSTISHFWDFGNFSFVHWAQC